MWDKVRDIIGSAAPMIGTLLGGPLGFSVGGLVASELGVANEPKAIEKAILNDTTSLLRLAEIESQYETKLKELLLAHAQLHSDERKVQLAAQHATIQAEIASNDTFVRRWRPTWGYVMCFSWVVTVIAVSVVMMLHPLQAATVIAAVAALQPMYTIGLLVLGVNIHKRSQDKQVAAGLPIKGVFDAVVDKFSEKRHG